MQLSLSSTLYQVNDLKKKKSQKGCFKVISHFNRILKLMSRWAEASVSQEPLEGMVPQDPSLQGI